MKCILCHKVECETLCPECLKEDLDVRLAALCRNDKITNMQTKYKRMCLSQDKLINPDEYLKNIKNLNSVKGCIGGDLIIQEQKDFIKNIPRALIAKQQKISDLKNEIKELEKELLRKNTTRRYEKIRYVIKKKKILLEKLGGQK